MRKINKRQDDIIRFIRHYEEDQLNPMIRTSHSITTRFDNVVKSMKDIILSHLKANQEGQSNLLYNSFCYLQDFTKRKIKLGTNMGT